MYDELSKSFLVKQQDNHINMDDTTSFKPLKKQSSNEFYFLVRDHLEKHGKDNADVTLIKKYALNTYRNNTLLHYFATEEHKDLVFLMGFYDKYYPSFIEN